MRIGVVCDDRWHPAETVRQGLKALELSGMTFNYMTEDTAWSADRMNEYPVTILTKSNCRSASDPSPWLTEDVQQSFVNYVEWGGGLFVIHSGTVGYANDPLFRQLVGGVFTHHPPSGEVTLQLEPSSSFHLNAESRTMTLIDEHYFIELDDKQAEVFMTSESIHGRQPAGWTRRQGNGRICVATPGHYVDVWQSPFYRSILQQGISWCAGEIEKITD
ncbi:ThuA domain-containing protein [Paenibacillus sp. UNC451MF]|uniref:ThuA domain-containing protein n=1 Tax=Paenibacillus sp. UNC451MF TaxID=1449063 RepID=UPI00048C644A|nr:ThuA domain-containing protein [Paenibacillus sp. UNC451MF]